MLEISRCGLFKAVEPDTTDWFRWGSSLTADEPHAPTSHSLPALARVFRSIRNGEYDLIVIPAIHADHRFDQPRHKLAAKSLLRAMAGSPTCSRMLGRVAVGSCCHIVVDLRDERQLCETALRVFPGAALYFKRELDLDEINQRQVPVAVRPLPLFIPDERQLPPPCEKEIDVVFAGALCNGTREAALEVARSLSARGVRVHAPPAPLPYGQFLTTLARSWLVLSPEGYGWDCYRHYEACYAGAVPVINSPRYRRRLYLEDGVHCFYYDADREPLAERLLAMLADKDRLLRMADAGRRHVLANHTRTAVARYMLEEVRARLAAATERPQKSSHATAALIARSEVITNGR